MYVRFVVDEISESLGRRVGRFPASAARHIARAHEMVALLAEHHVPSRMVRARRPGYVVYEDRFQVVAEPFRSELR